VRTFDLDRYLRASRRLDLDGLDFDSVPSHPLRNDEVRCLTYMMDIETHTVIYLRELLETSAAREPDVTAFLSLWVYEEFWHGEALGRFLQAAGERFEPDRTYAIRRGAEAGPLARAGKWLATRLVPDFIALHMTWGAINEISTLNGYRRVIARTEHPILRELLSRIIKDERRHYAFYYNQARMRLDGNRRAQQLVRWALDRFWTPVGTGVRPQDETDFVIACLFGGPDGETVVREMERELSKLPGLAGMRIMRRARARAIARQSGDATPRAPQLHIAAHL
jgi:hypothetical protein